LISQGVFHTETYNLSTLSRHIFLLYTGCQSGRTAAIARHVSFSQITCFAKMTTANNTGTAIL